MHLRSQFVISSWGGRRNPSPTKETRYSLGSFVEQAGHSVHHRHHAHLCTAYAKRLTPTKS